MDRTTGTKGGQQVTPLGTTLSSFVEQVILGPENFQADSIRGPSDYKTNAYNHQANPPS